MRILFVTQMWPGPDDPDFGSFLVPIRDELERLGHEVELVEIDHRRRSRTKYARLSREAIGAARRVRPDVVFTHMLFPAGAAGAFASIAGRAPLVVMAHGQDVANLGTVPGVSAATRMVVSRAEALICNSSWLLDRLVEKIPAARAKSTVADCGIDLDSFAPLEAAAARAEIEWDGSGPGFVCVGSLIERKNVLRLADAFATLGRGRLAFVGDGPLRDPCLAMLADAGLSGQAWLPGSADNIPELMRAFDVFVLPSLAEGISNTILEAMASGLPVIATDVGGNAELVEAGRTGVRVPAGDAQALADQMAGYAGDPDLRQRHGDAGCRRVAEQFSMKQMIAAYGGVYDRLMQQRGIAH